MKKLLALISDSYHEFKHVNTITTCAMFGAMSIVLNQLATIRVTPNLKIGFGALPNELVDYLFGPVVGPVRRRHGHHQIHAEARRRLYAWLHLQRHAGCLYLRSLPL